MWRLRERNPDTNVVTNYELRRAILLEIGTDPRTYVVNRKALIKLGWLKSYSKQKIRITGEDIE